MQALKDLILGQATLINNGILKVDGIINHQFQPEFMYQCGLEFKERFSGIQFDRILTVEVSGIPIATMAGFAMGIRNVTYVRKTQPITMTGIIHTDNAPSPTEGGYVTLNVSGDYLRQGENILVIDDFLASAETLKALGRIILSAKANLVGVGVLIEKAFQGGRQEFKREFGPIQIEALATILEMDGTKITFAE